LYHVSSLSSSASRLFISFLLPLFVKST
jgi:hypothetical protein